MEPFPDVRGLTIFPGLESKTLEFKETFSTSLRPRITNTIVSFLNAKGGYIVCGVEDRERKIVGLKATTTELDTYIRWFDDFYHGKRVVATDNSPLTLGEVEAKIVEVREGCYILVATVTPTPGKTYKTKEGITYWRLGASVYKLQESQHLDTMERELEHKLSLANRNIECANKERIAAEKDAAAAREEAKAAIVARDAALQKVKIHGTEMCQAQGKMGEYKRMLEEIRGDSLAIIGAAKAMEERLDLYISVLEQNILEKKAAAEEEIAAERRPWWKCW
jgi:predicted HTH transcriptional regulator